MYKLWAKKIKNNKVIAQLTIINRQDLPPKEKRDICIKEICKKLDLSVPIWMSKHDYEFDSFKYVTFTEEDFMDEIDFDKLVIELIDDDTNI